MCNLAARQLDNVDQVDAASCCYSITVEVDDPTDLTHLQLACAIATKLAVAGSCATLDAYACNWLPRSAVASLPPDRPFIGQREVSLIAETAPTPGFGYPVHTRGMIKFGRPDLLAGVSADRIEDTGRILNHFARMLAEGHILVPGQQSRFDGHRTLAVITYTPDAVVPEANLNNDGSYSSTCEQSPSRAVVTTESLYGQRGWPCRGPDPYPRRPGITWQHDQRGVVRAGRG